MCVMCNEMSTDLCCACPFYVRAQYIHFIIRSKNTVCILKPLALPNILDFQKHNLSFFSPCLFRGLGDYAH